MHLVYHFKCIVKQERMCVYFYLSCVPVLYGRQAVTWIITFFGNALIFLPHRFICLYLFNNIKKLFDKLKDLISGWWKCLDTSRTSEEVNLVLGYSVESVQWIMLKVGHYEYYFYILFLK